MPRGADGSGEAAVRERIRALAPAFLEPEDRAGLTRVLFRLRQAREALVVVACPRRWRTPIELGLGLGLLPERALDRVGPADPRWHRFLAGDRSLDPEGDRVWLVHGVAGADLVRTASELNFHRDVFMDGAMRAWLWLRPSELGAFARAAPDLWRYRSDALDLRVRASEAVHLPIPRPAIRWPWAWLEAG